jgi:hypothetical protein
MATSRTPPPVAVDLGPEPFWRAFSALLCALATAVLALWQCQQWGMTQHPVAWAVALALVTLLACMGWRGSSTALCRLEWTGREWCCRRRLQSRGPGRPEPSESGVADVGTGDVEAGDIGVGDTGVGHLAAAGLVVEQVWTPIVMIDLGAWMLLRLEATDKADTWRPSFQWVAVSQRLVGPSWHGLRVALYCAPPGRPDPLSTPPSSP